MSGKDLLQNSLAGHRATDKAEKRKRAAQDQGRGAGVKHLGNFYSGGFIQRGRGRGQRLLSNDEHQFEASTSTESISSETLIQNGKFEFLLDSSLFITNMC